MRVLGEVVVCYSGWLNVNVPDAGHKARALLIDPLRADVILYGTYLASDCGPSQADGSCLWQRVSGLEPIVERELVPMITTASLNATIRQVPSWSTILKWYEVVSKRYARYRDLSIWTPVLGPPTANVLREFYDYQQLLALLQRHEQRRASNYSRVIFSRLELEWLAPHPELTVLHPPSIVWVPWIPQPGLSDYHAVMSREHATFYLSRWSLLLGGADRVNEFVRLRDAVYYGPEMFLKLLLLGAKVAIGYYPLPAFLSCCRLPPNSTGTCWQSRCIEVPLQSPDGTTQRFLRGKYPSQVKSAHHFSELLRTCPGARLSLASHKPVVSIVVPEPRTAPDGMEWGDMLGSLLVELRPWQPEPPTSQVLGASPHNHFPGARLRSVGGPQSKCPVVLHNHSHPSRDLVPSKSSSS